jgi:hypothetical protein
MCSACRGDYENPDIEEIHMDNVQSARNLIERQLTRFAMTIDISERNDFFDSRNRDLWMREFATWLEEEVSSSVRASND